MITALDEMLWHQLPMTMDHVATSDPRFFDRFWFAAYAPDGSAAFQATIGVYRNMNVVDSGVAFIVDGHQHNVRMSRSLVGHNEMRCGPLSVEVEIPLRRLKIVIEECDESNISGEVIWEAIAAPVEEDQHFQRKRGRIVENYCRYNQVGRASGRIKIGGKIHEVSNWWACRDHSWGVRPRIGIREPRTGADPSLDQRGFTMAFLFLSTTTLAGTMLFMQREGEDSYTSGTLEDLATGQHHDVLDIRLTPVLEPRTRRFATVDIDVMVENSSPIQIHCKRSGPAFALQGIGYSGGYDDHKGLGVWRSEAMIEADVWDVSDPSEIVYGNDRRDRHWHRIQPVVLETSGAFSPSAGQGSMTLILSGQIPSLGLE